MNRSIFITLIIASLCSVAYAEPVSMTLAYEEKPNPPYSTGSGLTIPREKPGINIEVLKGIETKSNLKIRFERYNWKRCLIMLESGEVDGIFEASFKPERMSIGVYPMKNGEPDSAKRLMSNSYVLYKMKNSPIRWDGKQFGNLSKPIGATASYSIVGDLKEMGVNVVENYAQLDSLRMLVKGRLDGVADLETMTDPIIKARPHEFGEVVKEGIPIRTKDYYLMFSNKFVKAHPDIAEMIWNELRKIRESGEYDKIAAKYAAMPN